MSKVHFCPESYILLYVLASYVSPVPFLGSESKRQGLEVLSWSSALQWFSFSYLWLGVWVTVVEW